MGTFFPFLKYIFVLFGWMTRRMTGWMTRRTDDRKASFRPRRPLLYKNIRSPFLYLFLLSVFLSSFFLSVLHSFSFSFSVSLSFLFFK